MIREQEHYSARIIGAKTPIAHPIPTLVAGLALILIALSPFITALATWDLGGEVSGIPHIIRRFWLFTLISEAVFVGTAIWIKIGSSPDRTLNPVPDLNTDKLIWLALLALMILSTFSAGGSIQIIQLVFWCIHISVIWAGYTILQHSGMDIANRFWLWLVAGAILYSLTFSIFFILVPNPASYPWVNRPAGLTNIRHIGYFIGPAAITCVGILATTKKKSPAPIAAVLFIALVLLLWTGSRGPVFAFVISFIGGMMILPKLRRKKIIATVGLISILASGFSLILPTPSGSFGVIQRMLGHSKSGTILSDSGRIEIWQQTGTAILEQPALGYGPSGFRPFISKEKEVGLNHPHNVILQLAFNWGVPATLLFLLLFARRIAAISKKEILQKESSIVPVLVLMHLTVYSLYDGTAYYALPIFLMLWALLQLSSIEQKMKAMIGGDK